MDIDSAYTDILIRYPKLRDKYDLSHIDNPKTLQQDNGRYKKNGCKSRSALFSSGPKVHFYDDLPSDGEMSAPDVECSQCTKKLVKHVNPASGRRFQKHTNTEVRSVNNHDNRLRSSGLPRTQHNTDGGDSLYGSIDTVTSFSSGNRTQPQLSIKERLERNSEDLHTMLYDKTPFRSRYKGKENQPLSVRTRLNAEDPGTRNHISLHDMQTRLSAKHKSPETSRNQNSNIRQNNKKRQSSHQSYDVIAESPPDSAIDSASLQSSSSVGKRSHVFDNHKVRDSCQLDYRLHGSGSRLTNYHANQVFNPEDDRCKTYRKVDSREEYREVPSYSYGQQNKDSIWESKNIIECVDVTGRDSDVDSGIIQSPKNKILRNHPPNIQMHRNQSPALGLIDGDDLDDTDPSLGIPKITTSEIVQKYPRRKTKIRIVACSRSTTPTCMKAEDAPMTELTRKKFSGSDIGVSSLIADNLTNLHSNPHVSSPQSDDLSSGHPSGSVDKCNDTSEMIHNSVGSQDKLVIKSAGDKINACVVSDRVATGKESLCTTDYGSISSDISEEHFVISSIQAGESHNSSTDDEPSYKDEQINSESSEMDSASLTYYPNTDTASLPVASDVVRMNSPSIHQHSHNSSHSNKHHETNMNSSCDNHTEDISSFVAENTIDIHTVQQKSMSSCENRDAMNKDMVFLEVNSRKDSVFSTESNSSSAESVEMSSMKSKSNFLSKKAASYTMLATYDRGELLSELSSYEAKSRKKPLNDFINDQGIRASYLSDTTLLSEDNWWLSETQKPKTKKSRFKKLFGKKKGQYNPADENIQFVRATNIHLHKSLPNLSQQSSLMSFLHPYETDSTVQQNESRRGPVQRQIHKSQGMQKKRTEAQHRHYRKYSSTKIDSAMNPGISHERHNSNTSTDISLNSCSSPSIADNNSYIMSDAEKSSVSSHQYNNTSTHPFRNESSAYEIAVKKFEESGVDISDMLEDASDDVFEAKYVVISPECRSDENVQHNSCGGDNGSEAQSCTQKECLAGDSLLGRSHCDPSSKPSHTVTERESVEQSELKSSNLPSNLVIDKHVRRESVERKCGSQSTIVSDGTDLTVVTPMSGISKWGESSVFFNKMQDELPNDAWENEIASSTSTLRNMSDKNNDDLRSPGYAQISDLKIDTNERTTVTDKNRLDRYPPVRRKSGLINPYATCNLIGQCSTNDSSVNVPCVDTTVEAKTPESGMPVLGEANKDFCSGEDPPYAKINKPHKELEPVCGLPPKSVSSSIPCIVAVVEETTGSRESPPLPNRCYQSTSNLVSSTHISASKSSLTGKAQNTKSLTKNKFKNKRKAISMDGGLDEAGLELSNGKGMPKKDGEHVKVKKPSSIRSILSFFTRKGKSKHDRVEKTLEVNPPLSRAKKKQWKSAQYLDTIENPLEFRSVGKLLEVHPDGTRTVMLTIPPQSSLGFYIRHRPDTEGLFVSKFRDRNTDKLFAGLISAGDEVVNINGQAAKHLSVDEAHSFLTSKETLTLKLLPVILQAGI